MATEQRLPPSAASLITSMRDIGYTLETAVADLIDNSISAGAEKVDIYCVPHQKEYALAVIDDGCGMSQPEIIDALRHGGSARKVPRTEHDLGRFGLGLKTASFSQCRKLTVVSRQSGKVSAAEWDLDVVASKDDWIISVLNKREIDGLPLVGKIPIEKGTLVLWRSLDRMAEASDAQTLQEEVSGKLVDVEHHLALVYHRFLSGQVTWHPRLEIAVNGHPVRPFDPFCSQHPATQRLPGESIPVHGGLVCVQPYILPHHSKLSAHMYNVFRERSDFTANQGAYVYRNCRLIAWGDWFRIVAKSEATKLVRIQIDFSSAIDAHWKVDIKKSKVQSPRAVRARLRSLSGRITEKGTRVYKVRGQKLISAGPIPIWERYTEQGSIRYEVSRSHPVVGAVKERLDARGQARLQMLLKVVASALPIETIYADWATEPKSFRTEGTEEKIAARLDLLREALPKHQRASVAPFLQLARSTRLFDGCWSRVEEYVRGWHDG